MSTIVQPCHCAEEMKGDCAFPILASENGMLEVKPIGWLDRPPNVLKVDWFGGLGHVTFCSTGMLAVEEAVASMARSAADAALKDSWWYVVEVELTARQVTGLFMEKKIGNPGKGQRGCWRIFGDVSLADVKHDSHAVRFGPLGIDQWAHMAIGPRTKLWHFMDDGQCEECSATSTPTWRGYCAACWHLWAAAHDEVTSATLDEGEAGLAQTDIPGLFEEVLMEVDADKEDKHTD